LILFIDFYFIIEQTNDVLNIILKATIQQAPMDEDETLKRRLRKQKLTDKDEKYVQKLEDLKKHLPSLEKLLKSKSIC
jgi:5-bromo-4-chloroindolyl phosphate hydrolysis protein